MSRKVKWGILGCASIAKVRTIPGLLQADNAQLYAVASRGGKKAEEFRELFCAKKAYDTYEALLADEDVEAVYIPLPNSLHCEWVKKAAKAKKHILCEKPLALNEEQAKAMFDVCEEEGVLLMEAFAYRHAPLIRKVKELIDQGAVGEVKYLESHLTDVLTDMSNIRMNRNLGGGSFYDMACYNISAISYLLGFKEPVRVKALAEMSQEYGVDVSNTALLMYEDGVQAASYSSLNSYPRGYYAVVGEKGRIEVPCNFNCRYIQKFTVTSGGNVDNVEILDEEKTEHTVMCPDNYMLEIEQFGRCILEGEKPLVSKEETLLNARILDRIFEDANR
ncbi:Gfo/Idh/MocA family oxidoreductase [Faecalicatena contorta]|uniref:Gfo/Idh/MocA family oxidoreductase n=1 Tax=Faecalicatena fissicatena TaxID=290055 RepID=A0ABS2E9K2_9FIRM|nr:MULTISPECIES: Gfo/Idh/MocA family oxidoreductase [Clostridia]MBM6685370.1 Gfo/Idh/MocA family oxidoreductase [Faecalicatena contorta]MBM6711129.1 Gfo/Idh/MocA family oxidoreductase [Faecalicatena contorta]MBM6738319.1 Gfo/Idh/MocA family oxidoreductase [Faecalicatena fissicatena]